MSRNGRVGFWRGMAILLAGAILASAVWVGGVSNWYRDWSFFTGKKDAQGEEYEPPKDVTDGEGNELTSGVTYDLPQNMIFARTSAQSATASDGIWVSARVSPITATDQRITWKLSYKNVSSEWVTTGDPKPMANYVKLEPDENDSTRAKVQCLAPFGAQIVVTATSVSNPLAFDECVLDYAQRLEQVGVSFGSVVGATGKTNVSETRSPVGVSVALSADAEKRGGMPELDLQKSSVYTIEDEYSVTYALSGRDERGNLYVTCKQEENGIHSGLVFAETKKKDANAYPVTFADCVQEDTVPQDVDNIIKTRGLYFSIPWFMQNMGMHFYHVYDNGNPNFADQTNLAGVPASELIRRFNANYNGNNMTIPQPIFCLQVTVRGKYSEVVRYYEYLMLGYTEVKTNDVQIINPTDKNIIF